MRLRRFLGLQILMLLVLIVVDPELSGNDPLSSGIILNFAVFYLASMVVGFTVPRAPVLHALVVTLGFNLAFYLAVLLIGDFQSITIAQVITDLVSTVAFTVAGCYAGLRSRPQPSKQDSVN